MGRRGGTTVSDTYTIYQRVVLGLMEAGIWREGEGSIITATERFNKGMILDGKQSSLHM